MADLNGTKIIAPIVPPTDADVFPTHSAEYGKGGFRSVADIAARDAIPEGRREVGMRVYVESEDVTYICTDVSGNTYTPDVAALAGDALIVDASLASDIAGKAYRAIVDAANYINDTADAPKVILVRAGVYDIDESVIFKKAVFVKGESIESTVFRFTWNEAKKFVSQAEGYPFYSKAAFYFGDVTEFTEYYRREYGALEGHAGIVDCTIECCSEGFNHIYGYIEDDALQFLQFERLKLVQSCERSRGRTESAIGRYAIFWQTGSTQSGTDLDRYTRIRDIDITGETRLSGTISCDGSTTVTGSGTSFESELSIGGYIKVGTTIQRIVSITNDTELVTASTVGTHTDIEAVAYNQLDGGISINQYYGASAAFAEIENISLTAVMGAAIISNGHDRLTARGVYMRGVGWREETAGDNSVFTSTYTGFLSYQDIEEWRVNVPNEASSGQWTLIEAHQLVTFAEIKDIRVKGGTSTNSYYDGIFSSTRCVIENVAIANYFVSRYGVILAERETQGGVYNSASDSVVRNVRITDATCTAALYIEAATDSGVNRVLVDGFYCEDDVVINGDNHDIRKVYIGSDSDFTIDTNESLYSNVFVSGEFWTVGTDNVSVSCTYKSRINIGNGFGEFQSCVFHEEVAGSTNIRDMGRLNYYSGCTFVCEYFNVYSFDSDTTVSGCRFEIALTFNATGTPINLNARCSMIGCSIDQSNIEVASALVSLTSNSAIFCNNRIASINAANVSFSVINVQDDECIVSGNSMRKLSGSTNVSILIDAASDRSVITGNAIGLFSAGSIVDNGTDTIVANNAGA